MDFGSATSLVSVEMNDGVISVPCIVQSHDATEIICTTTSGRSNSLPVFVTVESQVSLSTAYLFSYDSPVLDDIAVDTGRWVTQGGFTVQLKGQNLHPSSIVYFNETVIDVIVSDLLLHQVC